MKNLHSDLTSKELSARDEARTAAVKGHEAHIDSLEDNKDSAEEEVTEFEERIDAWKAFVDGGFGKELPAQA